MNDKSNGNVIKYKIELRMKNKAQYGNKYGIEERKT